MTSLNKNVVNTTTTNIEELFKLKIGVTNPIDLSLGALDIEPSAKLLSKTYLAMKQGHNGYSSYLGIEKLRSKVASEKNTNIDTVLITNAASGAINLSLRTLCNQGDEVIIVDPYFITYPHMITLVGAVPVIVSSKPDFSLDIDAIAKAITNKTKVILINTPNNPTGIMYTKRKLRALASLARKHSLWILSDEVYEDITFEETHVSVRNLYQRSISLHSFSKSSAVPGWRIGYALGPKEIIMQMAKVQLLTLVCPPTPLQFGLCENNDIRDVVDRYKKNRDYVMKKLVGFDIISSQGGLYMFIRCPYNTKRFIADCKKKKLIVVPGRFFSQHDTHMRISLATSYATIKKAVKILNEVASRPMV